VAYNFEMAIAGAQIHQERQQAQQGYEYINDQKGDEQ
jgi:hypothetical protein